MSLNSPSFLFLFLPIFLLVYTMAGKRLRNQVLMIFSGLFLIWSDPLFAPFLIIFVCMNFIFLMRIQISQQSGKPHSRYLGVAIGLNLFTLLAFKALATYGHEILTSAYQHGFLIPQTVFSFLLGKPMFPLGFSFLAFQAINMLVDVSHQKSAGKYSFLSIFNFLLAFPKMISGPILRFREAIFSFEQRPFHTPQASAGFRRFITGFVKKTMIADQLALITDGGLFNQPPANIPTGIAWLAILCFTIQIYMDFSGYTDMAIGLGQVMGFTFPENFNYPYFSSSITEFWRRWHITLSGWFRDHVFFPLERKRRSLGWLTQPVNTLIVFLLTGLWHGITPPFIIWGLMHGIAISVEHTIIGGWQQRLWPPIRHGLTLLVVIVGWVFFRSPNLPYAWDFIKSLFGFNHPISVLPFSVLPPISPLIWAALIIGILLSFPVLPSLQKQFMRKFSINDSPWLIWLQDGLWLGLFILGIIFQAGTNYQPFIYGGF